MERSRGARDLSPKRAAPAGAAWGHGGAGSSPPPASSAAGEGEYQEQVLSNSQALAGRMQAKGYELVSGGTSNHLCLIDLRPKGVDGARAERIMEMAHIAVNKNTVPGDTSALVPGGIRIGTPALTSRGFQEADFEKVADFLDRAVTIAQAVDGKSKGKKFKDFREALESQDWPEIAELRGDVAEFARSFPTVGFEKSEIM